MAAAVCLSPNAGECHVTLPPYCLGAMKEVNYSLDSCTGQQRNLPFSSMCLYSVNNLPIEVINHFYFERGHSQMEGDSVHARIEQSTRKCEMFSPADWMTAVRQLQNNEVLILKT